MAENTRGLIAAPFTPLQEDGSLRLALIPQYAAHLEKSGVCGAFVNGTTGEGASLTLEERLKLAEAWVENAPKGLRVIIHVGHTCLSDSRRMAAHAQEIGAWGIGMVPPYYFKPHGIAELVEWSAAVAAAAPSLPFYYYHMPSMSGVDASMREYLEGASRRIPNLAGVKFTYEDLDDFQRSVEFEGGRFDILFGRDELLLAGLQHGATSAVGSTYNFAAALYLELIERYESGDLAGARHLQDQAVAMIEGILATGCGVGALKAAMNERALDCGPPRPPLRLPERPE